MPHRRDAPGAALRTGLLDDQALAIIAAVDAPRRPATRRPRLGRARRRLEREPPAGTTAVGRLRRRRPPLRPPEPGAPRCTPLIGNGHMALALSRLAEPVAADLRPPGPRSGGVARRAAAARWPGRPAALALAALARRAAATG